MNFLEKAKMALFVKWNSQNQRPLVELFWLGWEGVVWITYLWNLVDELWWKGVGSMTFLRGSGRKRISRGHLVWLFLEWAWYVCLVCFSTWFVYVERSTYIHHVQNKWHRHHNVRRKRISTLCFVKTYPAAILLCLHGGRGISQRTAGRVMRPSDLLLVGCFSTFAALFDVHKW